MPINVTGPRTHLRDVELPGGEVKAGKTVRELLLEERRQTLKEATIVTYISLALAATIAVTMRNQQFYHLEWYWTSIVSICVFVLCHRFGRIMFRRRG